MTISIKNAAGVGLAAVALTVGLAACGSDDDSSGSDMSMSMSQSEMSQPAMSQPADGSMMPTDGMTPSESMTPDDGMTKGEMTGMFMGMNDKMVSGEVTISGDTLMLSKFSSDEGPDLHLYLTDGTDEAAVAAGMEIGEVAFDQASQTFKLEGVDTGKYKNVVVHCDKAKAVFGAATLS